jgi:hypothetical protein
MTESNKITAMLAAAAVTGLLSGTASAAPTKAIDKKGTLLIAQAAGKPAQKPRKGNESGNACHGKNACRGQGGCFSGDKGCKGKNTCKGKGGCGTGGTGDKSGKPKKTNPAK